MEKDQTCYLTTFDNPYDPSEEFDKWLDFDIDHGYYTSAYLARIARLSPAMSEIEKERETERAIDEIIKYDFMNMYTKKYVKKSAEELAEEEVDPNASFDELINRDHYA
jgi:hypothetical protein